MYNTVHTTVSAEMEGTGGLWTFSEDTVDYHCNAANHYMQMVQRVHSFYFFKCADDVMRRYLKGQRRQYPTPQEGWNCQAESKCPTCYVHMMIVGVSRWRLTGLMLLRVLLCHFYLKSISTQLTAVLDQCDGKLGDKEKLASYKWCSSDARFFFTSLLSA